jgi:hypothetical protein
LFDLFQSGRPRHSSRHRHPQVSQVPCLGITYRMDPVPWKSSGSSTLEKLWVAGGDTGQEGDKIWRLSAASRSADLLSNHTMEWGVCSHCPSRNKRANHIPRRIGLSENGKKTRGRGKGGLGMKGIQGIVRGRYLSSSAPSRMLVVPDRSQARPGTRRTPQHHAHLMGK